MNLNILPSSSSISLIDFLINLSVAAAYGWILGLVYQRFGKSLSNRRLFGSNFVILAMTTTLIISIIKSSIALSLGLVGALSIVRFRAPIKEPEELIYLFLVVSLGLGLGAGLLAVTSTAFLTIIIVIVIRGQSASAREGTQGLCLTVYCPGEKRPSPETIINGLRPHTLHLTLRRLEESATSLEITCMASFASFMELENARKTLRELVPDATINMIDGRGLL